MQYIEAMNWTDRVKALLREQHLDQAQLGDRMGMTQSAISLKLNQTRGTSVDVLEAFADALGTTTTYLLTGNENFKKVNAPLDGNGILTVVKTVEQFLLDKGLTLSPDKKAELVEVLCENWTGVPPTAAYLAKLVRLAS